MREGDLLAREGLCVKILHRFGDTLWQKFPVEAKNPPGFGPKSIESILSLDGEKKEAIHDVHKEEGDEGEESNELESDDPEEEGDENENCQQDSCTNTNCPTNQETTAESDPTTAKQQMDKLMLLSFLQSLHTLLPKSQEKTLLPMDFNTVYATYLRPSRPPGTSVDVKLSSYKKLKGFFEHLDEDLHLVSLNKEKTKVTEILRNSSGTVLKQALRRGSLNIRTGSRFYKLS
jgi:hypothetical protein